jgi:hypothetical protein
LLDQDRAMQLDLRQRIARQHALVRPPVQDVSQAGSGNNGIGSEQMGYNDGHESPLQ